MNKFHNLKFSSVDRKVKVWIDDKELRGVRSVYFNYAYDGVTEVEIKLLVQDAEIEVINDKENGRHE